MMILVKKKIMMIVMKLSALGRLLHSGTLGRCQKHTKGCHQPLEKYPFLRIYLWMEFAVFWFI